MSSNALYETIRSFAPESSDKRYRVISLLDSPHKLGCSKEGFPIFFVVLADDNSIFHNLNAELLSVEYDILCSTIENDRICDDKRFTIISLRSDNMQWQKMFIDVFSMMLQTLSPKPTKKMIASKVESLLSIFAKLKRPPIHRIQGLWAELLTIEQSKDPSTVAAAWHTLPESKYDFTLGSDKIEVKSTSSENRLHRFSLDQLHPGESSRLLVCSVIVRESAKSASGLSVFDLYDRISQKIIQTEIRVHTYEVMLETLGNEFAAAQKQYFDYSQACDSLMLFDCRDIPKINKDDIPQHVSEVKFSSDLSHLTDIRKKDFNREGSSLFNALY